jgi:hypothetical protein
VLAVTARNVLLVAAYVTALIVLWRRGQGTDPASLPAVTEHVTQGAPGTPATEPVTGS